MFCENGELDLEGFKKNLRYLESAGIPGIVAMASVGQYYLLTYEELKKVVSAAREACDKMTCVVGTHAPSLEVAN